MSLPSEEQIAKSIRRAEALVKSENRLALLNSRQDVRDLLISSFQESVGSRMGDIIDDTLAEKFLPQARQVVGMHAERIGFIREKTLLGRLEVALQDFGMEGGRVEEAHLNLTTEELFSEFNSALGTADTNKIFTTLSLIVAEAINQMADTDLPPVAPEYDLSALK
jgi:hypothetical protein